MFITLQVAAMIFAAGASSTANGTKPLRLQIDRDGDATVIQVVGVAERSPLIRNEYKVDCLNNITLDRLKGYDAVLTY